MCERPGRERKAPNAEGVGACGTARPPKCPDRDCYGVKRRAAAQFAGIGRLRCSQIDAGLEAGFEPGPCHRNASPKPQLAGTCPVPFPV